MDTPYVVERYQQNTDNDGYTLADTEHYTGTTDTMAAVPEKNYPGFTVTPESLTATSNVTIQGDGSTVLRLYYNRNINTVTYGYSGDTDVTPPALPATASYRYGQTVPVAAVPSLPGYDFGGWETSDTSIAGSSFPMPDAAVTFIGAWTARADTPYTVEYYQQNLDDDGYTLAETLHGEGITGGNIPHKEFEGFTQTPDSVTAEGNAQIKSDGSTLLKLYYNRNINTVTYGYSGDTDVTPPALPATASYRYGQTVPVAAVPSLPGYDFGGWETSDTSIAGSSFTMPDAAVTFIGAWTARADTPYTVEYYQQNTEGDGYTLAETLHGEGVTGENIPHKEFEGFTQTPDSVTAEGSARIRSDGSTVLKLYYDRNINTVTYGYSGDTDVTPPALPATASYRYGQTVPVAAVPSLPGYDFGGWETSDTSIAGSSFPMPDAAVTFIGAWTARADTPYTVEYYQQNTEDDGYALAEILHGEGVTGENIPHKEFEGFTETPNSVTAEGNARIRSNGSTVLKLYYDRNVNTVTYGYSGDTDVTPPALPATASYRYGQTVPVAAVPSLPGYDFGGWETADASVSDGSFPMPDAAVSFTGSWMPRTDTPYTVEYYQQNIEDDGYTLAETEHCTGTTGGIATVPDRSYTGFSVTLESMSAATNVLIKSNGTTVLKLYYDRNVNTVSYAYSGETDVTPPLLPVAASYRYGQTVPVAATPSLAGYDFGGWETSDASVANGSFTMPDASVNITGAWTAKADTPYVVKYYQQNTDDDAYTLAFTFNSTGVTGTGVPHKEFEGFTQTPDSLSAEGSAKIRSDGSTVLKLYYDRNVNTVTYGYSEETDVTPPALPEVVSYRFGQTVPVAAVPSLPGYDFGGWETSDAPVVDGSFTMPDAPVNITGAWTTRTDIPYVIEYYQQNIDDDSYTLAETLNGEGAIGGSIPHKEFEGFTETPDSVTAEGSARIKSDGSTVLKLYYDRDYYAVSFAYSGSAPEAAPALPERANYRYGTSVPLPIIPGAVGGMSFSGWTANSVSIFGNTFSVPAQDTQITGTWTQLFDSGDAPIPDTPVKLEDNGTAYIIGYEDGAFRPDDYLTAKHETLMLSRLGLPVTPPSSSPEHLAEDRYITRKEFLGALLDASEATAEVIPDPLAEAAVLGWVSGYGDGKLYPDAFITRAQAVTIINRAFGRTAVQADSAPICYTDVPRNYWAYDAIVAASISM